MNEAPIVVEQEYGAPPEVVWQAITDPQQMCQWFFEPIAEFDATVGFSTRFVVQCEGDDYPHLWDVTEVAAPRRLAYRWRYEGIAGDSFVTWEIDETPNGTKLTLTHTGHETFPRDDPAFSRELGVAGWTHFLQTSLKAFLEGDAGQEQ